MGFFSEGAGVDTRASGHQIDLWHHHFNSLIDFINTRTYGPEKVGLESLGKWRARKSHAEFDDEKIKLQTEKA